MLNSPLKAYDNFTPTPCQSLGIYLGTAVINVIMHAKACMGTLRKPKVSLLDINIQSVRRLVPSSTYATVTDLANLLQAPLFVRF